MRCAACPSPPTPRSVVARVCTPDPPSASTYAFFADPPTLPRAYGRDSRDAFDGWLHHLAAGEEQYSLALDRAPGLPDGQNSLGTFSFSDIHIQPGLGRANGNFPGGTVLHLPREPGGDIQTTSENAWPASFDSLFGAASFQNAATHHPLIQSARIGDDGSMNAGAGFNYMQDMRSQYLLSYFRNITQPPASILITGVRKWRRLQSYFVRMSHQHRAVASALFAIIELFAKNEPAVASAESANPMSLALSLREEAQREVEVVMSKNPQVVSKARDALLATIFLLAWFEVVGDKIQDQRLFPSELADQIITSEGHWNSYSRQLLQWFNTLDSKSSHLGGQALLSQKALQVVSAHHTQISTEDSDSEGLSGDEKSKESFLLPDEYTASSPSTTSASESVTSVLMAHKSDFNSIGQMKTALLNTILQPALDWYLTTQSYCRRIGSHDRHHRSRFTVNDEYKVVLAYKQLEMELVHLWRQRPQIIRLSHAQLLDMVCADVAVRLDAIFSLYMASFWILFVYLHRVVWWHLPYSGQTRFSLEETWKYLQRSFGEVVEGEKKVVHPALLWPLFMFGAECDEESRRNWAVEQLEALGNASTVVNDDSRGESLSPFRLSIGATQNAKRAAILLRELIRRQCARNCRVDDKDLSMELFGCYFSII
ncbi:hypothetical protein B7494_g1345 [Chlorociboria aeruginascens]|nr:hypothetical protein B7494_g1345 [Chlorociboria aeruginascens]